MAFQKFVFLHLQSQYASILMKNTFIKQEIPYWRPWNDILKLQNIAYTIVLRDPKSEFKERNFIFFEHRYIIKCHWFYTYVHCGRHWARNNRDRRDTYRPEGRASSSLPVQRVASACCVHSLNNFKFNVVRKFSQPQKDFFAIYNICWSRRCL